MECIIPNVVSMGNSSKQRICVGLYFRQSITLEPQSSKLGHARFHWAIWIQPKDTQGKGICYQVMNTDTYANIPGSGGWEFNARRADFSRSSTMMGRIMVGKLPKNVSPNELRSILAEIPLPRGDMEPPENCVTWTMDALKKLQSRGWVEEFSTRAFADHATERANQWLNGKLYPRFNQFENYTNREA